MDQISFCNQIKNHFLNHPTHLESGFIGRESAVLVPLIQKENDLHILFEVRSHNLRTQPGDACFPGGRIEQGESPSETAIRETSEELNLAISQIELITPINPTLAPNGATLWAFLGILHDYENTFSKDEVDHIFTVPLSYFIEHDPEEYVINLISTPGDNFPSDLIPIKYPWKTKKQVMYLYRDTPHIIWGATARILYSLSHTCRLLLNG